MTDIIVDEVIEKIESFSLGEKKRIFTRVKNMLQEANKPFLAELKAMTTPELEAFLKSKGHSRADFFKIKKELDSRVTVGPGGPVVRDLEAEAKDKAEEQQKEERDDY